MTTKNNVAKLLHFLHVWVPLHKHICDCFQLLIEFNITPVSMNVGLLSSHSRQIFVVMFYCFPVFCSDVFFFFREHETIDKTNFVIWALSQSIYEHDGYILHLCCSG